MGAVGGQGPAEHLLVDRDSLYCVDLVLGGTFLCTKHAARAMRGSGRGGAIVTVSSLNAHVPLYGGSAYAAAKAGVESFTKNADLRRDFEARILAGRAASPDEVAGPALFLASDDASYVNGTSLVVDAGWEVSNYPSLRALL